MNRHGDIAGANPRAVAMFLHRYGELVTIYDDVGVTENRLNQAHPETGDWQEIGETLCMPHYKGANDEDEQDFNSGFRHVKEIQFIFEKDSPIKEDTHIVFRGEEYEITGINHRMTHSVANGRLYNEGSVLNG